MSSESTNDMSVPAGWYGDPLARGQERYWDGTAWTDEARAARPQAMQDMPRLSETGASVSFAPTSVSSESARPQEPGRTPTHQPSSFVRLSAKPKPPVASPVRRLLALTIDAIVCNVVSWLALLPLWLSLASRLQAFQATHPSPSDMPDFTQAQQIVTPRDEYWLVITWLLVSVIYQWIFIAWRSATPGQLALQLRVVDIDTYRRPHWISALKRAIMWSVFAQWPWFPPIVVVTVASALAALAGSHQTLHDWAGNTLVVDRPEPESARHFADRETALGDHRPPLG